LAKLAQAEAFRSLPATVAPYAQRFAKDAEKYMSTMPPELQGNPDAWRRAINLALADHFEDISKEEREMAVRQETERRSAEPAPGSGQGLLTEDGKKLPSLEEFAGPEGM